MSVLLILVARERKYAEMRIQIIVEKAILKPVPRFDPSAILVPKRLLSVIRLHKIVSIMLIINTMA